MPTRHNLKSLPEGCRGVVILKRIIFELFNYVEQDGHLKISIGCFWVYSGSGRGLVALQSLLTVKKGTNPSNFQSNESFLKLNGTTPSIRSALV